MHKNIITVIGKNTEKSPGDLKGLAFTPTPVKFHHLTLVLETPQE